jgi:epoxyqueuosine reductase
MAWMADRVTERANPALLWPEVKSILLFGMAYTPDFDPLAILQKSACGAISSYARSRDYHDVIKGKLKSLARFMLDSVTNPTSAAHEGEVAPHGVKVFVDTAPVMEKTLAAAAGLGWQGKHTVLVSRAHGNWLFLGAIYTTLALPKDSPEPDHCGTCTRCLSICPTDAFPKPYQLDATRCIAYLTIEHKGPIDRALRPKIGNRIFGCDDCLAVCPWNRFAKATREIKLKARPEFLEPRLADLVRLDDAAFRALFAGTPVKRTGRDRFVRNVLIAIGNSGDPTLAPEAQNLLQDPSPLVRGAAIWALSRLLPFATFAELRASYRASENDSDVLEEWDAPQE